MDLVWEIRLRAWLIGEQRQDGRCLEHWLAAQHEVTNMRAGQLWLNEGGRTNNNRQLDHWLAAEREVQIAVIADQLWHRDKCYPRSGPTEYHWACARGRFDPHWRRLSVWLNPEFRKLIVAAFLLWAFLELIGEDDL